MNYFFFKALWFSFDRDCFKYSLHVNLELDWQILVYGVFDFPLLDVLINGLNKASSLWIFPQLLALSANSLPMYDG